MAYEMRGNTLFNVQETAQSNQPSNTYNGNPGGIDNTKRAHGKAPPPVRKDIRGQAMGMDPALLQMILPEFMYNRQGPMVNMAQQNSSLGRYRPPTIRDNGGGSGMPAAGADPVWNDYGGFAYNIPNQYGMWQGTPEMGGWGGAQQQMYPDYLPQFSYMGGQRGGRQRMRRPMNNNYILPEFGGY
jgi:hypothetical protein